MDVKLVGRVKDSKNKTENSNTVEVSLSESILSYQNGSSLSIETPDFGVLRSNSGCVTEGETSDVTSHSNSKNVNNECMDLIRKKLISDFSLGVFRSDLENEIIKMDAVEISKERLSVIQKILTQINHLSDSEKLLLYLKLPSSANNEADPLRQPLNPLGNRQEVQQTIAWIKTHLTEDSEMSVPKQDVYNQYLKYCKKASVKALTNPDFGKVMKQVYPGVKPRRLGTRGNSRYCYSGMRNIIKLPAPSLPLLVYDNKITNVAVLNDSNNVKVENEKSKKKPKPKRKWKPTSRNPKTPSTSRSSKSNPKDSNLISSKRSKVQNSKKENEILEDAATKPDLQNVFKTVELQDNYSQPFNDFNNINCELGNDFDICFDTIDPVNQNNAIKDKVNLDFLNKIDFQNEELNLKSMNEINSDKLIEANMTRKVESVEPPIKITPVKAVPLGTVRAFIPNSAFRGKRSVTKGRIFSGGRLLKLRCRRSRLKLQKRRERNRAEKKTCVPIKPKPTNDADLNVNFGMDVNNAKKEVPLCEEIDSQEPEEEIIKYFQHLEEDQLLGMVEESVMNSGIDIGNDAQTMFKPHNYEGVRSQSCFENHSIAYKPFGCAVQSELPQRSQSSVEFSAIPAVTFKKQGNRDQNSHLRFLLEKSDNMEQPKTQDNIFAQGRCEKVPDSPSTAYFNFTPISPGPRTQTPITSPFPSFHTTKPIPNNQFLPPTDSNITNFNIIDADILSGDPKTEKNSIQQRTYPKSVLSNRPRSQSSTNFYCTKTKRNLSKVLSWDEVLVKQASYDQNKYDNISGNANAPFPPLSGEIQDILGNQSKFQSTQSSSFRSQSVPVNRMLSEGSLFSDNNLDQYLNEPTRNEFGSNDYNFVPDSENKNLEPLITGEDIPDLNLDVFAGENQDISDQIFATNFNTGSNNTSFNEGNPLNVFSDKINETNDFQSSFSSENIKSYLETLDKEDTSKDNAGDVELFGNSLYESVNDNAKDPVITSFKPVVMGDFADCPASPALEFFTGKESVDNQLIEYLGFD